MKCPFITIIMRKLTVKVDEAGKRVGEEAAETAERADCLREECMVYDKPNASCSLFSANVKAGQILAEVKKSANDMGKALFERTETIGVIFSTNFQTMQDAMIAKLDLLRKSTEVLVMGIDRSTGSMEKTVENLERLFEPIKASADSSRALEKGVFALSADIKGTMTAMNNDLKAMLFTLANEWKTGISGLADTFKKELAPMVEDLKNVRQAGTQLLEFTTSSLNGLGEIGKGIDLLGTHIVNTLKESDSSLAENLKTQLAPLGQDLKSAQIAAEQLLRISGTIFGTLGDLQKTMGPRMSRSTIQ